MDELQLIDTTNININTKTVWKEWCKWCKKNHLVTMKPCPDCGVYHTPQPKSEKVYSECRASYICNGCEAYLDHF